MTSGAKRVAILKQDADMDAPSHLHCTLTPVLDRKHLQSPGTKSPRPGLWPGQGPGPAVLVPKNEPATYGRVQDYSVQIETEVPRVTRSTPFAIRYLVYHVYLLVLSCPVGTSARSDDWRAPKLTLLVSVVPVTRIWLGTHASCPPMHGPVPILATKPSNPSGIFTFGTKLSGNGISGPPAPAHSWDPRWTQTANP